MQGATAVTLILRREQSDPRRTGVTGRAGRARGRMLRGSLRSDLSMRVVGVARSATVTAGGCGLPPFALPGISPTGRKIG
jgi:hypothetical protein